MLGGPLQDIFRQQHPDLARDFDTPLAQHAADAATPSQPASETGGGGVPTPDAGRPTSLLSLYPSADVLTRRLKRLADLALKVLQKQAALCSTTAPGSSTGNDSIRGKSGTAGLVEAWSKKDRLELMAVLMKWGVPLPPGGFTALCAPSGVYAGEHTAEVAAAAGSSTSASLAGCPFAPQAAGPSSKRLAGRGPLLDVGQYIQLLQSSHGGVLPPSGAAASSGSMGASELAARVVSHVQLHSERLASKLPRSVILVSSLGP